LPASAPRLLRRRKTARAQRLPSVLNFLTAVHAHLIRGAIAAVVNIDGRRAVPMARAAITTGVIGIGIGTEKVATALPNAFPSRKALPVARNRRPPQASPPPHPPAGRSPRIKPSAASLGVVVAADAVVGVAGVGHPVAWGP
jgi:hypothetical protein